MAYKKKTELARRDNYGNKRSLNNIKYLVYHFTSNDGDTDEANASYFNRVYLETSAHAFVDDDSVTISVPANYVAWAVGSCGLLDCASPYHSKGGKYFGRCTNSNSYSIEMCDTKRDGKHNLSKATRRNAIEYGAKVMVEYNIPIENVLRHFDVNAKLCPIYWVTNEADWKKFKEELLEEVSKIKGTKKTTSSTSKNSYTGVYPIIPKRGYFKKGDKGVQVQKLQRFLNWAVNSNLKVDGELGDLTLKAVYKFQRKVNIQEDGLFGRDTLQKAKKFKR